MRYDRPLYALVQAAIAAVIFANSAFAAEVHFPDSATRDAVLYSLNRYRFDGEPITTVTASSMAGLTSIVVDPANREISDATGLELARNTRYMNLGGGSITELAPLAGLTFMVGLDLPRNQIADLSDLRNLTAVTALTLYGNAIQDLTPLANMTAMTRLDVSSNMIEDLTPLQNLTALRYLKLGHNQITNLQALRHLHGVEELILSGNPNLRLETLPGMPGMRWLTIADSSISDISALSQSPWERSKFPLLESIILNDNMVTDLSPLANNQVFHELRGFVNVQNNPLSQRSIDYHIPALRRAGVTVEFSVGARITGVSLASTPLLGTPVANTYGAGETIQVEISFDAPVTVTGAPQLTLTIGSVERQASYTSGSGGTSLTFSYEVQPTDSDADGIAVGAPALTSNDPDITGTDGYRIPLNLGRHAIASNPDHRVDGSIWAIHIPDANLRAALEAALGRTSGAVITGADVASLTELYAPGAGITDLSGLEYAIGLERLWLFHNSIEDLTPLAGMGNLVWLDLGHNAIKNIGPLAGLSNLTRLNLIDNQLTDIRPLENLVGLLALLLSDNSVTDIAPLAGMTSLRELGLGGNRISDLEPLRDMADLELLDLRDNRVSNLSPLAGMTKLTSLGLTNNLITDIAPLTRNTGLGDGVMIDLRGNTLSWNSIRLHYPALENLGVSVVIGMEITIPDDNLRTVLEEALGKASGGAITDTEMATLTNLGVSNENVVDLTGMEFAVGLKKLTFFYTKIQDLAPLAGLFKLTQLELYSNPVKDVTPLANLTGLRWLDLSSTLVEDLTPLANLTGLKALVLNSSKVTDFTPLRGMTGLSELVSSPDIDSAPSVATLPSPAGMVGLEKLELRRYLLTDLTFVAGMPNLTHLSLESSQTVDLTPLASLTGLRHLALGNNAIRDIAPLAGLTNLSFLSLGNNQITDISPLVENTGLGFPVSPYSIERDHVDVRSNPLNQDAYNIHIPALRSRLVDVFHDAPGG